MSHRTREYRTIEVVYYSVTL